MWEDNFSRGMRKMQRKLDRVFTNIGDGIRRAWADFDEKDEEYILHVELPGVEKEDIVLDIVGYRLEIKAKKNEEVEEEDSDSGEYRYARSYRGFARSIDLPEDADIEGVEAEYKNGILIVKIPKKEENVKKKKKIEVS